MLAGEAVSLPDTIRFQDLVGVKLGGEFCA
ncbi:protein of unknown function [Cupriavidus neocaledonicus]|uniref:Uncharacterized protein n=1 Tax=Cupriavidus neocaledonicus TaxID=1040979 RepID=A0A375H5P8_9BURK|nr:hypothetical protein CBM2605_A60255 [Cupriavidus neocaledonicus]SPD45587.1 protein of unknown function [Cupriavidus neocaledonicus]